MASSRVLNLGNSRRERGVDGLCGHDALNLINPLDHFLRCTVGQVQEKDLLALVSDPADAIHTPPLSTGRTQNCPKG